MSTRHVNDYMLAALSGGVIPPETEPEEPGAVTHGIQLNEGNTGFAGLGLDESDLSASSFITTTHNGQVIEFVETEGISIRHNDVTVRGCYIHNENTTFPINVRNNASNCLLEFNTIHQDLVNGGIHSGIAGNLNNPAQGSRHIARRNYIHDTGDGIRSKGGWLVEENFIDIGSHQYILEGEPYHADGMQAQSGAAIYDPAIAWVRNKVIGGRHYANSAMYMNTISGDIHNIVVDSNYIAHFQKDLYLLGDHQSATGFFVGDITVTNNYVVVDWPTPGSPTVALIAIPTTTGVVTRSGNRRITFEGEDQGSADP